MSDELDRVVITQPVLSGSGPLAALTTMQVCAVADADDKEILLVCNRDNPSGTTGGWQRVIRKRTEKIDGPGPCADYPGRIHYLVQC